MEFLFNVFLFIFIVAIKSAQETDILLIQFVMQIL